jgi:hypothetical protein
LNRLLNLSLPFSQHSCKLPFHATAMVTITESFKNSSS